MMKYLSIALLLVSLSFAQSSEQGWLPTAGMAIGASIIVLAIIYMFGYGFNAEDLKFLAKEEFYQVIITLLMIALLQGADSSIGAITTNIFGDTLQNTAIAMINADATSYNNAFEGLYTFAQDLGFESSKSFFCSVQGTGYSISSCSSYRAIIPAVSLSFQSASLTIAELNSLKSLIEFGSRYGFALLLPIGILLRTFKFTRGAGGFMVALAIAFYLFLPLGFVVVRDLTNSYEALPVNSNLNPNFAALPSPSCDSTDISLKNYNDAKSTYDDTSRNINRYLYFFMIKGTLTAGVSILVMVVSLRWISKLAGAEVDVSALTRVA